MTPKPRICSFVLVLALTTACAGPKYDGPVLHQVMNETCADEKTMLGLYNCVDRYWYRPVAEAGLGYDPDVQKRMALGRNLQTDVHNGVTSNKSAMAHWRADAIAWKERVEGDRAAMAQGMRNAGKSLQDLSNSMDTRRPVYCSTTYGQVTSSTTCY